VNCIPQIVVRNQTARARFEPVLAEKTEAQCPRAASFNNLVGTH
jgi:hypothetical protein